jgi:hypothetical protein
MQCKFNTDRNIDQSVTLDGTTIPVDNYFRFLESIIQKDRKLDSIVAYQVKTGWLK